MKSKLVETKCISDENSFVEEVQSKCKPCVLEGLDIGPCKWKWTEDFLCEVGSSKMASVHVCDIPQMNFVQKNYQYRMLPFCELVKRASKLKNDEFFSTPNEYYYFRSLGKNIRKDPSNFNEQWPELCSDICIPNLFPREKFFSSVLRIASAGTQLWTHYDVMDNILIQVRGRKKVTLFPPSDALNLYLEGDKSIIIDIENPDFSKFPKFEYATKYECFLNPGDILFIPALWFHNVVAIDFGIAVNVFWKNLDEKLYDHKDPYGNKDLIPAARSMDILNRALKVLNDLPDEYKDFYAKKMVSRIEKIAYV